MNAKDQFMGWADVGMTDEGRKQAVNVGHRLAASGVRRFDDLHSSASSARSTLYLSCRGFVRCLFTEGAARHGVALGDAARDATVDPSAVMTCAIARGTRLTGRSRAGRRTAARGSSTSATTAGQVEQARRARPHGEAQVKA